MGLFYKNSDKQSLEDRNNIFKEVGIIALKNKGFVNSPFNGDWHGEYDKSNQSYLYQFCRIQNNTYLEILYVSIYKQDNRINFYLYINEFFPKINSINELVGYEGLPFSMTVKNKSKYMRLRNDDYKVPPLFYMLFLPEHKIGNYYTKSGYEAELTKLKSLIKSDMENIDTFVKRWHEIHKPSVTDWYGNTISY